MMLNTLSRSTADLIIRCIFPHVQTLDLLCQPQIEYEVQYLFGALAPSG